MRTQTLRLAVRSYLSFNVCLWMIRILGIVGVVALPFNFGATGAPGDSVTLGLLLMSGVGILGMSTVNRRLRREQTRPLPTNI